MKKSRWKVAAVAVLLLFVAGVFWFGKASQVEVITISERELVERLVVTGTAEPGERSELGAERPGRVLAVAVREGDYFQQGEVLVGETAFGDRSAGAGGDTGSGRGHLGL